MTVAAGALRPPLWVRAVDVLTIASLFLALAVWTTGGFVLHPAGMRISFHSEWRIVLWAAGLLVVRHLFFRRPTIHSRLAAGFRAAARTHLELPHDDIVVAREPRASLKRRRMMLSGLAVFALFWVLTLVMTYPQIRVIGTGVSPDVG